MTFFALLVIFIQSAAALVGDECIHFSYFSSLVSAYDNICKPANDWAEWIYLPNAFGDKTYEDIQRRVSRLQYENHLLTQRTLCHFIFPTCVHNKKHIEMRTKLYRPAYNKQIARLCRNSHRIKLLDTRSIIEEICQPTTPHRIVKDPNPYLSHQCPKDFSISHTDYEESDHQFVNFMYCINQRAESAHENDVIMKIYKIGQSVQGRDLVAVEMWVENDAYNTMPESRIMGNIHGNEDQGLFILTALVNDYSVATPQYKPEIYHLLSRMRVHILVSLNPDGFMESRKFAAGHQGIVGWLNGRNNFRNRDLNRDFPYLYQRVSESIAAGKKGKNRMTHVRLNKKHYDYIQPETVAAIRWSENHNFVVSSMIHSGAWVFNYPYDTSKEHPISSENLSDDSTAFIHMGRNFTSNHQMMRTNVCDMDREDHFVDGITNGAAWYSLQGTLQDYGYIARGIMEITLEMGCTKTVHSMHTNNLYEYNKKPFLYFLWQTYTGVHGVVIDHNTYEPIKGAEVFISACTFNTTVKEGCTEDSKNYEENRQSALTGAHGQYYKVYYPKAIHSVICVMVQHEKYKRQKYCFFKLGVEWDRPENIAMTATNFELYTVLK